MKKFFIAVSSVLFLFGLLVITGCDSDTVDNLVGPTDKWCYKQFTYENNSDTTKNANFDCYCYYATADKNIVMGVSSDGQKNTVTLKKGLNIIIANDTNSDNKIIEAVSSGKTPFVFKSFADGDSMSVEDDSGAQKNVNFKKSIWNVIYLANSWEQCPDSLLPFTKDYSRYESVENLKDGFSMSKVIKKMAANKLVEILSE